MLLINNTVSLCEVCYKHIPAVIYEQDEKILMTKRCSDHGEFTSIVETDKNFYYNLTHHQYVTAFNALLFEVTDRCQLNCPHCYHLPDNRKIDKPIDDIVSMVKNFPKFTTPLIAGAEPTLRPDLPEICSAISKMGFDYFDLLSNAVRFADIKYAEKCRDSGLKGVCVGLNHPNYQGQKIHEKQLKAIKNLIDVGMNISYVGYTMQSLDEIPFILEEIEKINHPLIGHFRLRCGSFIGRSNDQERSFLSKTTKYMDSLIGEDTKPMDLDDNPYHVMLNWKDQYTLRVIQWPDVTNIDMEELVCGPWCNFVEGPVTNFVHQVILRDAFKNNKLPQLDLVPEEYSYRDMTLPTNKPHWKENWDGPVSISSIDWKNHPKIPL